MTSHITTSGGLISAAFIENVRQPGSRQRGVEPESFALVSATLTTRPWAAPPRTPAALEETIATAWELLLERWDAVRADLCSPETRNTQHAARLCICHECSAVI